MLQILNQDSKNNAKSKWIIDDIQAGLKLMRYKETAVNKISLNLNPSVVQYFFCLKGSLRLNFPPSDYSLELNEGESYFFYNPQKELNPLITAKPDTKLVFIFCTLEKIHELFVSNTEDLHFLKGDNINKKYYKKDSIPADLEVVLNQLHSHNIKGPAIQLFLFAKILETFSIYFSKEANEDKEYCPYLNDDDSVRRIKKAKEVLISQLEHPPTIEVLAEQVGLNEFRLKEGFKSLYGTTLFQYLLDYKMNKGRGLLDSGKYKVQEVAYDLGYSNPSHFISAFKNKFGVTPKKYLGSKQT